ncbi:hypothetical protein L596_028452 [Steinernema carpocapsae]|uniref:Zinc finger PHD-type domain-containing protein n=1 Tax=Steinernema carpocapsae TaxID=34508 RepID=A0A4U5LYL3_STECR|nr:hypothetical protein L596_028452 [Steinernema carpocapsae]
MGKSKPPFSSPRRRQSPTKMKTRALEKKDKKEVLQSTCRVCGDENGYLIKCANCSTEVHCASKCIGLEDISFVESERWLCSHCVRCASCDGYIDDPGNRVCFKCLKAFHGPCAPPTSLSADGLWKCAFCDPEIVPPSTPVTKAHPTPRTKSRSSYRKNMIITAKIQWHPGLQEERDRLHNNLIDHYKRKHDIKDEMDPELPSTSSIDEQPALTTDIDRTLYLEAKERMQIEVKLPVPNLPSQERISTLHISTRGSSAFMRRRIPIRSRTHRRSLFAPSAYVLIVIMSNIAIMRL